MARVVVVGASGHGRKVADALVQSGHTMVGFIDTNKPGGTTVDQWEVLGTEHDLSALLGAHSLDGVVMGIGDNAVRVAVAARVSSAAPGLRFISVVHPTAFVASGAELADGAVVMPGALVSVGCRVGAHALVDSGASLDHDSSLDDGASLAPGATVGGNTSIGTCTAVGIGATVIHGRTIGAHTVVGAGAVVVRDLPGHVVAYGVPATVARQRDEGERYL